MSGILKRWVKGEEKELYGFKAKYLSDGRFKVALSMGYGNKELARLHDDVKAAIEKIGSGTGSWKANDYIDVYVNGKPELGLKGDRVTSILSSIYSGGGFTSFVVDPDQKELFDTIFYRLLTKPGGSFQEKVAKFWGLDPASQDFTERAEELAPRRNRD